MISYSLWSALIVYYFIMFATPGPNNAMLTASGMKFGYLRTLPHIIGIPLGHFIQITLVCYGLGNVFIKFPQIQFYMKFLCFVYLLYLSWKMLGLRVHVPRRVPAKGHEGSLHGGQDEGHRDHPGPARRMSQGLVITIKSYFF